MQNEEQIFERKIVKMTRIVKMKRRGSQDPPKGTAQFKTASNGYHEWGRYLKTRSC